MRHTICIAFSLLLYASLGYAYEAPNFEKLANAIYLTEGGAKTRFPYGIKSVSCKGEAECRKVCLNTLRNNWRRWLKTNPSANGDGYLEFLANRYCPPSVDPIGNARWKKNVTYFLTNKG